MDSTKRFVFGVLVGSLAAAAAVAGLVTSMKRTVIDPVGEKETMIKENRRKAMRKRISR